MQLTIEVLPAPLGPIMENSSPALTPKLTSVSARTPPKRSDTPRTSKAYSTHSLRHAYSAKVDTALAIRIRVIQFGRLSRSLSVVCYHRSDLISAFRGKPFHQGCPLGHHGSAWPPDS